MARPSLWITYSWTDDKDGDFSFLVQELRAVGIDARFDRITLIPGQRLWQQLGDRITKDPLGGWAYLITPNSLASEPCREELAYALDRALHTRGGDFPLIGLLQGGVRIQDVPPALRVRLCVSLASPTWKEEVLAGLQRRPPEHTPEPQSTYVWNIQRNFGGQQGTIAIEVRPRFGELPYWRIAVPEGSSITAWGIGPAGGASVSPPMMEILDGVVEIQGMRMNFFGSSARLSPSVSAFVVLNGGMPGKVGFGVADRTDAIPRNWEIITPRN